jgi:nitrous oxidase accessory protein NosD
VDSVIMMTVRRTFLGVGFAAAFVVALSLGAVNAFASTGGLYVSASSGNDANSCSAATPCATIGRALAVAGAQGARIRVAPGTYREQVNVTSPTDLIGYGATIDATGLDKGIMISGPGAAGSHVRGFTVENANTEGIFAVSTWGVTIAGNTVLNNDQKHDTDYSQACMTVDEVPGDCGEALHLMGVADSRVLGNDIENNIGGILITDETGPSHGNLIKHNVSRNNPEDCGITLPSHNGNAVADPSVAGVYGNFIVDNLSEGNGGAGVGMFAPFPGTASYNNYVVHNTLRNNGEAGIAIHGHTAGENVSGNVILHNDVSGNGVDPDTGSGHPTGIALLSIDPTRVVVLGNRISNEYWGIFSNGPLQIFAPQANRFAPSVSNPVGHA